MKLSKILVLFLATALLHSCQKEEVKYIPEVVTERSVVDSFYVAPGEARTWFESKRTITGTLTSEDPLDIFSLDLDWSEARNVTYSDDYQVSLVPVKTDLSLYFPGGYYNMFFFRDSIDEIRARLVVFEPEKDYALNQMGRMSVKNFTGVTLQVDETRAIERVGVIQNGVFTHYVDFEGEPFGTSSGIELRGDPSGCPTWGRPKNKILENFGSSLGGIFNTIGNAVGNAFNFLGGIIGNNEGNGGNNEGFNVTCEDLGNCDWGSFLGPFGDVGNHGGGASNLRDYFTDEIFNNNQVGYQMSECFGMYSNETTPLIFATHRHTQDWDIHFVQAVNYYLRQNSMGLPVSFATSLQMSHQGLADPLVPLNNQTQQAMLKVYQKMVLKYHGCKDELYASTEGPIVFDLGSSELCNCIKNYTADDALRDFLNGYIDFLPTSVTENPTLRAYLQDNPEKIPELLSFYDQQKLEDEDLAAKVTEFIVQLEMHDRLYGPVDNTLEGLIEQYLSDEDGAPDPVIFARAVALESARLRLQNPGWSSWRVAAKAIYNVSREGLHLILDGLGMIPVGGEIADLANGTIYVLEGDWTNASFSFLSAIPIYGWFSTVSKYAVKAIPGRGIKLVWHKSADGLKVIFASDSALRSQLRRILGTPADHQAHHIIPLEFKEHPVIQQAAKGFGEDAWHPNELANGINVSLTRHNGSHKQYSDLIESKLESIFESYNNNISSQDAISELRILMDEVRTVINNNPTTKINDLIF